MKRATVYAVFLAVIPSAFAGRISGVTATTSMGAGFGTLLINTVNGVGLSALTLTANHAATIPSNSWVSSTGILTGMVTFNLGALYTVDSFSFWNQNGGGPGPNGITGIHNLQVLTSTDGSNFNLLSGGPSSFAQVPTPGGPPEIFNFSPVSAAYLRFNILSNWGDTAETGFAEVGFNNAAAAVPEPSTLILLTIGLGGLYFRPRR